MPVYDDEKRKSEPGAHDNLGVHPEHREAELADLEKGYAGPSAKEPDYDKTPSGEQLGRAESKDSDQVGQGYNPDDKHGARGQSFKVNLKGIAKKRGTYYIASLLAGLVGILLLTLSMLPLKVVAFMTNVDHFFGSAQSEALDSMDQKLFNRYVVDDIVHSLRNGECKSTVSPACVVTPTGSGPVGKLYHAWAKQRMEYKLASDYHVIFAKEGGQYFMNVNGTKLDLHNVIQGKTDIFHMENIKRVNAVQIDDYLRDAFKDATLWDKTYTRFKVSKYLSKTLGLPRCVGQYGCRKIAKVSASLAERKIAAKLWIINRVVSPTMPQYAYILECLIAGTSTCNTAKTANIEPGDTEEKSKIQQTIDSSISETAAELVEQGADLDKLADISKEISEKGVTQYVIEQIITKMAGQAAGQTAGEAVPIIGWTILGVKILAAGETVGSMIQHVSYIINSQAAAMLYQTFETYSSQIKSSNVDMAEVGSFSDALASNTDPTSTNDYSMTEAPMYNIVTGGSGYSDTSIASLVSPTASAAGSTAATYCPGNTAPPPGALVCNDEVLDRGNFAATEISTVLKTGLNAAIPGLSSTIIVVAKIAGVIMSPVNWALGEGMKALSFACGAVPICSAGEHAIGSNLSSFLSFLTSKLISPVVTPSMNGAHLATMVIAGADVSSNQACQNLLGCQRVSDQQANGVRTAYLDDAKRQFNNQPLYTRIFSKTNPNSLVSRMAMAMPSSFSDAGATFSSALIHTPATVFSDLVGGLFNTGRVFADSSYKDPFGVDQYAFPSSAIPSDPNQYWQDNCAAHVDSNGQYDDSYWLKDSANIGYNSVNGQYYNINPNPCLLIQSASESAGAMFDPSLVSQDEAQ